MVIVLGSTVARKGKLPALLALSQEHVARSRAEPGCVSHGVHVDTENPERLVFVEEWADLAALQQHFKVPASKQFAKELVGLSAAPSTLSVFEATRLDM